MSDLDYGGGSAPPAEQRPIPIDGLHDAVCYAVVNWGDVLDEYDGVPKGVCPAVRFFFELDETMPEVWTAPDGRQVRVDPQFVGKRFVLSTFAVKIKYGERAGFVTLMKAWLGSECPEKLSGYPLGTMKGRLVSLNVAHKKRDDGTFTARIANVLKARAGATPMLPENMALPAWWKSARDKDNQEARAYQRAQALRVADAIDRPEPADSGFDSIPLGGDETPF